MADIVIDLNEPAEVEPEPGAVRRWWLNPVLALVALLTLVSAAGGQPQGKPVFYRVAMINDVGGRGVLGLSATLVFRYEKSGVAAHRLDGTQVWWASLGFVLVNDVRLAGGRVIAYGFTSTLTGQEEITVVLNADTGQELWRVSGTHVLTAGSYLVEYDRLARMPTVIRRSDTLEIAWQIDTDAVIGFAAREANALVYVAQGRQLTERELATGKVLRTATLDSSGPWDSVMVDRDRINLMPQRYGIDRPLTVDRATLTTPSAGRAGSMDFRQDCGQVDCLFSEPGMVSIVDKATGRELWKAPYSRSVISTTAGMLIETETGTSLAEYSTGNQVPLPGWELIGGNDQTTLMRRTASTRGATEIAALTPGGLVSLGWLPFILTDCQISGDRLICGTTDQKIVVWRIELPRERDHH